MRGAVLQPPLSSNAAWPPCRDSRIAYIHIPKTGGVSLFSSLVAANVSACNEGTDLLPEWGLNPICDCGSGCMNGSNIAVVEVHHSIIREYVMRSQWGPCTTWMATIREPQEWFYSAVGQWCQNHPSAPECLSNASLGTLLDAGWFDTSAPPRVKYYFRGPSLQSRMLEGIWEEPNWAVCSLPANDVMRRVLGSILKGRPALQPALVNEAGWADQESFRQRIPWTAVQRYYAADEAMYARIAGHGCVGRGKGTARIGKVLQAEGGHVAIAAEAAALSGSLDAGGGSTVDTAPLGEKAPTDAHEPRDAGKLCIGIECVPRNGNIVLTTASAKYVCRLNNWLRRARAQTDAFLVVVMRRDGRDGAGTSEAERNELQSQVAHVDDMALIWRDAEVAREPSYWSWRLAVLEEIMTHGSAATVLLSDADAVFAKDPMPTLRDAHAAGYTIVGSTGTFPEHVRDEWATQGFPGTLCMGFVSLLPGAVALVRTVRERTADEARSMDDQIELNTLLSEQHVSWRLPSGETNAAISHEGELVFEGAHIRVGALSQQFAARGFDGEFEDGAVAPAEGASIIHTNVKTLQTLGLLDAEACLSSSAQAERSETENAHALDTLRHADLAVAHAQAEATKRLHELDERQLAVRHRQRLLQRHPQRQVERALSGPSSTVPSS